MWVYITYLYGRGNIVETSDFQPVRCKKFPNMQHLTVRSGTLTFFPLDCQIKKPTTSNTRITIQYEWILILPIFLSDWRHIYACTHTHTHTPIFGVPQNFSNYFMCAMRWKMLKIAGLDWSHICGFGSHDWTELFVRLLIRLWKY